MLIYVKKSKKSFFLSRKTIPHCRICIRMGELNVIFDGLVFLNTGGIFLQ